MDNRLTPDEQCEHKWVHLTTDYQRESNGYVAHYTRQDTFYCEKCLQQKTVDKKEHLGSNETPPMALTANEA